jgi:signal transduction histidine kinase
VLTANAIQIRTRQPLARRIIVHTILFSSLITLVISALQLGNEYAHRRATMDQQLDGVDRLLPAIAESLWTYNDRQLHLALKALTGTPNFEQAAIRTPRGKVWSMGTRESSHVVVRTYPLSWSNHQGIHNLGSLEVTAGIDPVYQAVITLTAEILLGNAVKTFLVAAFMAWLIHHLVTSRLPPLSQSVADVISTLPVSPDDEPRMTVATAANGDEIDHLRSGFAAMALRLRTSIEAMRTAERELQSSNAALDLRVQEKTTQLEQAWAAAEDAAADVLHSMEEQRNFISMISHEVRTPLAVISAASQVIALEARKNPSVAEEMDKIHRAVQRMSCLVDEYLCEERLETMNGPLEARRVDLSDLIRDACAGETVGAPEIRLEIVSPGPVHVNGDASLLTIALSNVVSNAIKYSPPQGVVTVSLHRNPDRAEIRVHDQGPGIPHHEQSRIFEKYYRGSSHTGQAWGVGLGLYLVKRIVALHDGTVAVDSQDGTGAGTTFTLSLPLAADQGR